MTPKARILQALLQTGALIQRDALDDFESAVDRALSDAYADAADIAGAAPDIRYALTGTRLADFVRGRTTAAEAIRAAYRSTPADDALSSMQERKCNG